MERDSRAGSRLKAWITEYRTRGTRLRRWVNGTLMTLGAALIAVSLAPIVINFEAFFWFVVMFMSLD